MYARRFFTFTALAGMVILVAVSCSSGGGQNQEQVQAYPVLKLQPRSVTLTTSYPATLRGVQTVEIRPRVQGNIVKIFVDEGAVVKKGETLFQLNNEEYQQQVRSAKADIEAAKAGVESAHNEVDRLKPLVEKDIISNYRLETAKNDLQSKKAVLSQAQAALENAKVNLGYTYVKSPADGVIGTIPYRVGSLVSSTITQPLTTVSDISKVYAYFSMSERELLQMTQSVAKEKGKETLKQRVAKIPKVNFVLADNTMYAHQGKITLASGLIGAGTGSASFRALFPNPQQILRSGGSGSVQVPLQEDSVIAVPQKSTYEIQNKRFVYVLTDSNTVRSAEIQILPLSTSKLFVVEKGLSPGDRIVVEGTQDLQDDTPIKPEQVNADSLYKALKALGEQGDS